MKDKVKQHSDLTQVITSPEQTIETHKRMTVAHPHTFHLRLSDRLSIITYNKTHRVAFVLNISITTHTNCPLRVGRALGYSFHSGCTK